MTENIRANSPTLDIENQTFHSHCKNLGQKKKNPESIKQDAIHVIPFILVQGKDSPTTIFDKGLGLYQFDTCFSQGINHSFHLTMVLLISL